MGFVSGALVPVNAFIGALFLLSTILLMAFRQVEGYMRYFIWQSVLLVLSTADLAVIRGSPNLFIVAVITLAAKVIMIPLLLRRVLHDELRTRREVELVINTQASLLVALLLSVMAYLLVIPVLPFAPSGAAVNLPVGLDVLLIGMYTLAIRREAVPQMLALMAIDNGVFYAGVSITDSPAIIELAAGLEGVMVVVVVTILARTIAQHIGSTAVGHMATLKEGESR